MDASQALPQARRWAWKGHEGAGEEGAPVVPRLSPDPPSALVATTDRPAPPAQKENGGPEKAPVP